MGTTGAAERCVFPLSFVSFLHLYPQTSPGLGSWGSPAIISVLFQSVSADWQHFSELLKGSKAVYRRLWQPQLHPRWFCYFYMFHVEWKHENRFLLIYFNQSCMSVFPESPHRPFGCRVQADLSLLFRVQIGFLFFPLFILNCQH